jgi:hypothetical protein
VREKKRKACIAIKLQEWLKGLPRYCCPRDYPIPPPPP